MGEPVKVLHAIMTHSQPEMPPLHSLSSAGPAPFVILPSKLAQFMLFMAESYNTAILQHAITSGPSLSLMLGLV